MRRENRERAVHWGSRALVLAASLLLLCLCWALLEENPLSFGAALLTRALGRPADIAWTLLEVPPLLLTGLSVVFARRAGLWNVGAEGQYLVGMMAAALVGIHVKLPVVLHPLLCVAAGMLAAAVYGWIAGVMKAYCRVGTLLSGILLNAAAVALYRLLTGMPWMQGPGGTGLVLSDSAGLQFFEQGFPEWLEGMIGGFPPAREFLSAPVHGGIFLTVVACVLVALILGRSVIGYEFRAVSLNAEAARQSGITPETRQMLAMAWAGALAGLAGAVQLLGPTMPHALGALARLPGYGLAGLAVSFAGTLPVSGVLIMSLLCAVFWNGGESAWVPEAWVFVWIGIVVSLSAFLHPANRVLRRPRPVSAGEVKP